MGKENVEAYRSAVAAWNRGDIDGLLAPMDADVEIESFLGVVEGQFHGHEGVRRWREAFHEMFPDWHAEVEGIDERGETTVARLRVGGHGRGSGAPIDQLVWHVVVWRDGKVVRLSAHRSEEAALAGLGDRR